MQIKCIDNEGVHLTRERLVLGKVYEIDPRRDITFEPVRGGKEKCYWVNGQRYAACRFVSLNPRRAD